MTQIKEGMRAPLFEGIDQNGRTIKLSDFKGKKVVLYFYPKDNTPGCVAEACNLRDNYDVLLKNGYAVIGVSMDSEKSHQGLPQNTTFFLLLPTHQRKYLMITEYTVKRNCMEGVFLEL
jgi:peroxiredoxin